MAKTLAPTGDLATFAASVIRNEGLAVRDDPKASPYYRIMVNAAERAVGESREKYRGHLDGAISRVALAAFEAARASKREDADLGDVALAAARAAYAAEIARVKRLSMLGVR